MRGLANALTSLPFLIAAACGSSGQEADQRAQAEAVAAQQQRDVALAREKADKDRADAEARANATAVVAEPAPSVIKDLPNLEKRAPPLVPFDAVMRAVKVEAQGGTLIATGHIPKKTILAALRNAQRMKAEDLFKGF